MFFVEFLNTFHFGALNFRRSVAIFQSLLKNKDVFAAHVAQKYDVFISATICVDSTGEHSIDDKWINKDAMQQFKCVASDLETKIVSVGERCTLVQMMDVNYLFFSLCGRQFSH